MIEIPGFRITETRSKRKTLDFFSFKFVFNSFNCRQRQMTDVRNNGRCIWDSEKEATRVWERIKHHIPAVYRDRKVMGLNERYKLD